jgi:hypothetical protein
VVQLDQQGGVGKGGGKTVSPTSKVEKQSEAHNTALSCVAP